MNGTRDTIIETAFLLFLKKGFKAVTLTDLGEGRGDDERDVLLSFLEQGGGFERGGDEVLPYVE